ncbi:hypothetical protein EVAR_31061_1 [Eumeta japonica]|uniref:Uncharacterized protein n=1 Tax=Eumeta variegata TaxID=151549 RepID=A0A4C1XEY4_EUMVA|nr:hypothetical protein EVAR_31061_1 [Eumeta japonica]
MRSKKKGVTASALGPRYTTDCNASANCLPPRQPSKGPPHQRAGCPATLPTGVHSRRRLNTPNTKLPGTRHSDLPLGRLSFCVVFTARTEDECVASEVTRH